MQASGFIRRAAILAAGRGTRMGEITAEVPKPMLPVRGRPMLAHVLKRLHVAGVEQFLVVVGYRREVIEEHFQGWPGITFREQYPVDGTGSAARLARDFAGGEPFFLTFGDILCEPAAYLACGRVLEEHSATGAVLGARYVPDPCAGAAVYEDGGRVSRVIEKPPPGTSTTHWNSAGLYAMRSVVFDYLDRLERSPRNEYELTSIFETMLRDGIELRMSPVEGVWRDVGRPGDLAALNG